MIQFLKTIALSAIAVFAPAKAVLLTVMALTICDLISGILASIKQQIPITSSGLKRTVVKVAVYQVAALAAFLVEQYLTPVEMPIMKMVTGLIGMTELKSVLENLDIIAGGSIFSSLIAKLSQGANNAPPSDDQDPTKAA